VGQQPLEGVDVLEPRTPHVLVDQSVHPRHQNVLVVRTVEDADLAPPGNPVVDTPEEVVGELFARRLLERGHPGPLRVHTGEDVFDGAILARGIQTLEDDQQGPSSFGPQPVLQIRETALENGELRLRGVAVPGGARRGGWIEVVEINLSSRLDAPPIGHRMSSRAGGLRRCGVAAPDEDGTVGVRDEVLGDGSEEHPGELAVAATAQDQELGSS